MLCSGLRCVGTRAPSGRDILEGRYGKYAGIIPVGWRVGAHFPSQSFSNTMYSTNDVQLHNVIFSFQVVSDDRKRSPLHRSITDRHLHI